MTLTRDDGIVVRSAHIGRPSGLTRGRAEQLSDSDPRVPWPAVRTSFELARSLGQAGFLTGARLRQVCTRIQSGRFPSDAIALATLMVRRGWLTEYQARHALNGTVGRLVIGRYVITERLGRGAMSRVYLARHRMLCRTVALKLIAPELLSRRSALARFRREIQLVGRLDHPHIVRALDADCVGGLPYIAMEYVPGTTLKQLLVEVGPLAPAEVARMGAQAASALAHAHGRGIIHRDVKPANLLLGDDGRVRLLDLGLGTLVAGMEQDEAGSFATADGVAVGTIDYMSPEQAAGRLVDSRSDQFSLGCTLFHLLAGTLPFPGDSRIERLARRLQGKAAPIPEVIHDVPRGLADVLDRLMAPKPEDRFPTAADAAAALEALIPDKSYGGHAADLSTPERSMARPCDPDQPASPAGTCVDALVPSVRGLSLRLTEGPLAGVLGRTVALIVSFAAGVLAGMLIG